MSDSTEISVERLAAMIANLDEHIQARAEQIAAPRIAQAAADAAERIRVAEEHAAQQKQRDADLIAELRRCCEIRGRVIEQHRTERRTAAV